MKFNRLFRSDISTQVLILANIVTIVFAVVQKWKVADILWLYLAQSLIIALFICLRILSMKQFSTEGMLDKNKKPFESTLKTKRSLTKQLLVFAVGCNAFFAVLLYLIFGTPHLEGTQVAGYAICILVFLADNGFSYLYNRKRDRKRKPAIGTISGIVLMRNIPMLIIILLGWPVKETTPESALLVFFLLLKTIVDVTMHNWEHIAEQEEKQTGSI